MATKADKKNAIRQDIIDSAGIYSQNLAGKAFLYVYGEEFFEVSFPVDHFLHLTGVETNLSAKDFYKNAKKAKLTNSQFYFDARHPYANARKKLPCLKRLPELTNDMVCILKDMQTVTIIYKLSVTNLEFTLGLTENTDANEKDQIYNITEEKESEFVFTCYPDTYTYDEVHLGVSFSELGNYHITIGYPNMKMVKEKDI